MISNPYRIRTPLSIDELHVGRVEQVDLAVDTLCGPRQPQSSVFYGVRKIGKSSLLRAIARRLESMTHGGRTVAVCHIEGTSIDTPSELSYHLVRAMSAAMGEALQADASFEWLAKLAQRFARNRARMAVLIDDFDHIVKNPAFDVRIFEYLRALISDGPIGMVLTARRALVDLGHREVKGSPFFNVLHERWMPPLCLADVRQLLQHASHLGVDLSEHANSVLADTGGLPLLVQSSAEHLFDTRPRRDATCDCPTTTTSETEPLSYLARLWRSLSTAEQTALRQVATGRAVGPTDVMATITLQQMGLVERTSSTTWRVPCAALQRWCAATTNTEAGIYTVDIDQRLVCITYAREDKDLLVDSELVGFLRGLEHRNIQIWYDERIAPGQDWHEEIATALERADVIVCLVSQYWLNSEYVMSREVPIIIRRLNAGARVVPVLVSECTWSEEQWLAALQFLPPGPRPIRTLQNRGEREAAYLSVLLTLKSHLGTTTPPRPLSSGGSVARAIQ